MNDVQLFNTDEYLRAARRLKLPRPKSALEEARAFGGWTLHKLDVLKLYLAVYRRVAGNGTYIDGFAGDGVVVVDGEKRQGSAAIALASGAFKTMLLYEQPRRAKQLERWLDDNVKPRQRDRCQVRPGDFNQRVVKDLEALVPFDRPCFAFLDPNSTELDWATVKLLARHKAGGNPPETCKIELWILLNSHQVLMRLMPRKGPPDEKTLDRWLGPDGWRDLHERGAGPGLFVGRYAQRLMDEFGYGAALPMLICDPKTKRPQYYMIHASDHPTAHDFMRWAGKAASSRHFESPRLPGLE